MIGCSFFIKSPLALIFVYVSGDLMQIAENVPEDYEIITCCFAHVKERANYCYHRFVTDDEDCVLDADGKRFEAAGLSLFGKRGLPQYVKAQVEEDTICFQAEPIGGDKEK
jgi:hypothetical protein